MPMSSLILQFLYDVSESGKRSEIIIKKEMIKLVRLGN
jgi:hypothetical protein